MTLPPECTDFTNFSLRALQLLHDYQWVYSFKAIEFLFPKNCSQVPLEIKTYFQGIKNPEYFRSILNLECQVGQPASLKSFIDECQILATLEDGLEGILCNNGSALDGLQKKRNWPRKKLAEVLHLSQFVETISQENNCDLIVDVGSGLGYLSSHLAENTGIDVLAIESESDRLVSSHRKAIPTTGSLTSVNLELTSNVAIQLQPYTDSYKNICITGLHACGDLTPWSLQLFLQESKYRALAIVPCCYHKMNFGDGINFPMSYKLKDLLKIYPDPSFLQNLQLCRLASQRAGENFLNDIQAETKRVFFRSLLELYFHKENLALTKNKRRGVRGCLTTFEEYLSSSIGPNGGFSVDGCFEGNSKKLRKLYKENLHWLNPITGILAMQGALQPIAENLILLDRLEYLVESGKVDEAQVKQVIPKSITPRGRVIFATKKIATASDLV